MCYRAEKLNDIAPNVSLAPAPPKSKDNDSDVSCDDASTTRRESMTSQVPAEHDLATTAESDLNESLEIDVSSTDDNETVSNNSDSGMNAMSSISNVCLTKF